MPLNRQKENRFLKLVKYSLPLFTVIISACFILFIVLSNQSNFKKEAQELRKNFIASKKEEVKNEVEKVHKQIEIEKRVTQNDLRNEIRQRVYEAYAIAYTIFNKYKNKKSEEEILTLIKDTLKNIRFNNDRGYYFIYDRNGVNLMHPIDSTIEGKNQLEIKDIDGNAILKGFLPDSKDIYIERFSTWYWYKPFDSTQTYKKIGFHKYFEPFDFYIATGEYIADFESKTKTLLLEKLQNLKYGKNGSITILDYDGNYLSHVDSKQVGQNHINLEDENGFLITKAVINTAINGSGFISYYESNYDGNPILKTSYIKGFNDWYLAVESGFDNNEIDRLINEKAKKLHKINKEYIQRIVIVGVLITLILFILSLYLSRILERYFIRYRTMLIDEAKKVNEKDQLLAQQSKMAALGEMLENIAHQWRQPLSVITTSASGIKLEKQLKQLKDEDEERYLNTIITNAKHLSQTIDDFREFLKSDKTKEHFDLQDIVDTINNLLSAKFKNSGIEMIVLFDKIELYGLRNEFIQVLMNIINNSIDAFEQNNIKKRLIFIEAMKKDDYVLVCIKDSAGGIPKEILNRIFEPYFTTKHQYSGTGIGLYMSREIIVRNMHGTINVQNIDYEYEDEKYKGALFELMLKDKRED